MPCSRFYIFLLIKRLCGMVYIVIALRSLSQPFVHIIESGYATLYHCASEIVSDVSDQTTQMHKFLEKEGGRD